MDDASRDLRAIDGLTTQEAGRRLRAEGPNELPSAKPRSGLQRRRFSVACSKTAIRRCYG
jgi:Cation transporter/ATPase, N-terminus